MNKNMTIRFLSFISRLFVFLIMVSNYAYSGNTQYREGHETLSGESKVITFQSEDSLDISADLYLYHDLTAPFIILFHQAGWSRGEYLEIAPKLNSMGFNCMAVDQRSGGSVNGVDNQTHKRATEANKSTTYLAALQDMVAALKFVKANYIQGKLLVWGSSYSASLVIKLASEYPELVDGVLSFAPGEYFSKFGKSKTYIAEVADKIACPIFITSAKHEKPNWEKIYKAIPVRSKHSFLPTTSGNHGSRALWQEFTDSKDYWLAVTDFLERYYIETK